MCVIAFFFIFGDHIGYTSQPYRRPSSVLTNFLTRLTGLLSFMLSDEMTTGSVTSSDSHKRMFAMRSHSWNTGQPKFREAFPDVSLSRHI
jgi:hypothetical protein